MQKEEPEEAAEANGDSSSGTTVSKDKAKKELTPEQKAAKAEEEAEKARIKEERIQKLVSVDHITIRLWLMVSSSIPTDPRFSRRSVYLLNKQGMAATTLMFSDQSERSGRYVFSL